MESMRRLRTTPPPASLELFATMGGLGGEGGVAVQARAVVGGGGHVRGANVQSASYCNAQVARGWTGMGGAAEGVDGGVLSTKHQEQRKLAVKFFGGPQMM